MPITGQGAFAQFAQTINQQQGTAVQFAAAMARLKQAEQQFEARHKFEQEAFKFKQQTWEAEKELLNKRLERLDFENQQFQQQAETQKKLPGAFTKLATGMSAMASAATGGDKEALQKAQEDMAKIVQSPEVAEVAHIAIPQMYQISRSFGYSPEFLAQTLGKSAQATPEFLGGVETIKFERELKDQLVRNIAGKTEEEMQESYSKQLEDLNRRRHVIVSQISAEASQLRLTADTALADPALAQRLAQGGFGKSLTEFTNVLQQARSKTRDSAELTKIDGWIEQLRQLQNSGDTLTSEHQINAQMATMADYLSKALVPMVRPQMPGMGYTEGGAGASALAAISMSKPLQRALSTLYTDLRNTKDYQVFMETKDEDAAQAAFTSLMQEVIGPHALNDPVVQDLFAQSLWWSRTRLNPVGPAATPPPPEAKRETPPTPPSTGGITIGPAGF